jgi:hypothetical protein
VNASRTRAWPRTWPSSWSKNAAGADAPGEVDAFAADVAACATTSSAPPSASPGWNKLAQASPHSDNPPERGPHPGQLMILKFLRLLKIFTVATKYGLDEIAMSGFDVPRTAR